MKEEAVMLIDWSAMKNMIEGDTKSKSKEMLEMLTAMEQGGKPIQMVTTMAQLLGAIYIADPKTNINDLQKMLNVIKVRPSFKTDFKSEDSLRDEIMLIANILSGKEKNEKL